MEAVLPKAMMSVIGLLYPPGLFLHRIKQHRRQIQYQKATIGLDQNMALFGKSKLVCVSPEAKKSYEHFCWRDERMVIEMRSFLRLVEGKKCLYDIGALHGVFSFAFAAETSGLSFAFEPSPQAAKVLNEVRTLNPKLDVSYFPVAVGERKGRLGMKLEWQHLVAVKDRNECEGYTEVDVTTLDEFVASNHTPPDCIKIDVEGYELEVLRGAVATLKTYRPIIFLELHPHQLQSNGNSVGAVIDLLAGIPYAVLGTDLRPFKMELIAKNSKEAVNAICLPINPLQ
jgi:FkbM family methyltransferase